MGYHFQVTLTSGLVSRIIMSGAYLVYYLRLESQIWCVDASWDNEVGNCNFDPTYFLKSALYLVHIGCVDVSWDGGVSSTIFNH